MCPSTRSRLSIRERDLGLTLEPFRVHFLDERVVYRSSSTPSALKRLRPKTKSVAGVLSHQRQSYRTIGSARVEYERSVA